MDIAKISPEQKKIIIIGLTLILAFLILWLFIYLPSQNAVRRIKSELVELDNKIREIETIIDRAKTIDEGLNLLKQQFREVDRFPAKEEESIKLLSDFARKLNFEVISIKSQSKTLIPEFGQKEPDNESKAYQVVLVSVEGKSSYKALFKYLQTIKRTLPAFSTIERLRINKDKSETGKLNIMLDLKLYLRS